jgi:hypothetical protein
MYSPMSRLTFDQKVTLWKLRDRDPTSFAGAELLRPATLQLRSKTQSSLCDEFKEQFLYLSRLQSGEWDAERIAEAFEIMAELWSYFSSIDIPDLAIVSKVRFLTVACQIIFSAMFYGEMNIGSDSNTLAPMFLEHPKMIIDLGPILRLMRALREAGDEFWPHLVIRCGEELIRAHSITFGSSELTDQLEIRVLASKIAAQARLIGYQPTRDVAFYAVD